MKVQTVTVEIHEKRNHPNEYGHYDARVAYTVELDPTDDADRAIEFLQFQARQHVANECDRWIAEIERRRMVDESKAQLGWIIDRASEGNERESDPDKFELYLIPLSEGERVEYTAKLMAAKLQHAKKVDRDLQEMIDRAKTNGLNKYHRQDFEYALEGLPESERDSYRQRMEAALASKAEAPAKEDAGDIAF